MKSFSSLPRRVRATAIHVLVSACVAVLASLLVFVVWYPSPYGALTGGTGLFVLLMSVDLVLGPVLTAVVANAAKPSKELLRDIAVIACLQVAAFAYGIHTIAIARPVIAAFEVDRLRVVTAVEIEAAKLPEAPEGLRTLSWTGPRLIAARKPTAGDEAFRAMTLGLGGVDLSMVPAYWTPYDEMRADVLRVSRPAAVLAAHYPEAAKALANVAARANVNPDDLRFLPLVSRRASWVALIAQPDARIVGHLPLDGFF
ncbi:TfpX/TfpZ family type IV pilin accessory protein [Rhizobacter sp. SG703]|uniref:TfpX/TfpZ family type IV pilin accessory protein n=1 Tax=Rhizobacter sp. SG703 TaxID=2587140 RepID=UPI001444C6EE|nr:TfpX/TfpZ family type IV pilin accessory protein [Rhizobacter sp. SG703]NKI94429.1 hypothetical protein [Rhizobacter sp. SG703]